MSAADIPQSLKKRRSSGNYSIENQGLVDLSGVIRSSDSFTNISSILKRKSDISRSVDMTRHTIEPATETTSMSIVKRQKVPSNQAVAVVSAQKMVGTPIFHPAREEAVSDIATFNKNQDIVSGSQNKSMSRRRSKNPFAAENIINAQYKEMTDEIIDDMASSRKYKVSSKPEFSKAPPRDARDLGLAQKSRVPEPTDFAVISEGKRRVKSEIVRARPKPANVDTNWLIDKAFDKLVDTAKVAGKVGKVVAKEGFHVTKTGIRAVNEICEEVSKNPNILRIKAQQEADMKHMRSARRRARNSIAAGGNKRTRTAASLVTQHGVTKTNTTNAVASSTSASNPYGIVARYEKVNGRIELHYYYNGYRITHEKISRVLTKGQIKQLKNEAMSIIIGKPVQASTTPVQTNQMPNKPAFNGGTHRTLNKPKAATRSGLVHRNKSGVV